MPPKKAASAASRPTKMANGVKAPGSSKAANTAAAKKAPTKPAKPAKKAVKKAPTPAPVETAAPTKTAKRKSEDDVDEAQVNGTKRQKGNRGSVVPASPKTKPDDKLPVPKTTATKKPKTAKAKVVINKAPTNRLDVYCFGEGASGELGLGSEKGTLEVKRPRLNPKLAAGEVGVVYVAVGGMHCAVLTHDNKILTWGVNDQGALGRDTTWDGGLRDMDDDNSDSDSDSASDTGVNPKESTPAEVDLKNVPEGTVFTQLACSDSASFALTQEGLVYGWGTFRGNDGIIGFSPASLIEHAPVLVPSLKKITNISCGANHVLALASNGSVFAWGSGQQNQLGRRIIERMKLNGLTPREFGLPKSMVTIGTGSYHSFAVHKNGKVYAWGLNSYGETGIEKTDDEDEADVHHPTVVKSLEGKGTVVCIEGGAHHTVAVTNKGECLVWGRLDGYQLGIAIKDLPQDEVIYDSHNKPRILTKPTQVPGVDAVCATAGSDHCVAITKQGKAFAWGFSATYQTGLGTDDDVEVATMIDNTAVRGKQLIYAAAGGQFSVIAGLAEADKPLTNGVH